jgi:hypothetical protein
VRKLPLSLQISVALHALVVTWAVSHIREEPAKPPPAPRIEVIDRVADDVSIDVTFLDVPATEAPPEAIAMASEPKRDPQERRVRGETAAITTDTRPGTIGTTGSVPTGTGTTDTAPQPGKRNPLLDMRKGAPTRLTVGVPTGRWDGRDKAPETYGPDIDTGRLDPSGGGTYRSDEGPFSAKVGRDGSVKLKDKRNFNIHFALPGPKQLGRIIADWYEDPNKPVGTLPPDHIVKQPVLNNDEHSGHLDKKPDHGDVATIPIVRGGFDITDAFMRNKGIDPYASRKLEYLDSTRDQRVQIGNRYRQKQLDQAAVMMKGNLDRVWSLHSQAERREALFELWDECAETGSDELVTAGREARKLLIGTIRAKLPAGSADAFSAAEIAAFNKTKQSKATFAPYD